MTTFKRILVASIMAVLFVSCGDEAKEKAQTPSIESKSKDTKEKRLDHTSIYA